MLDLVDKGLVTDQMVLTVGYDIENLTDPARRAKYHGAVGKDPYGREIPKQAHGSINLDGHTSSTRKIMCAVSELFDRIVDKNLLVRRMYVVAKDVYKRQLVDSNGIMLTIRTFQVSGLLLGNGNSCPADFFDQLRRRFLNPNGCSLHYHTSNGSTYSLNGRSTM